MMRSISCRKLLVLVPVIMVVGGCGVLFNSGPAAVMLTSNPNEAEVWIDGSRRGTTPMTVSLPKNQNYQVVFRKVGHDEVTMPLNRQVSATIVILDVLGGLVPVIIDAATGAWYVLSESALHATLSPALASGKLTQWQLDLVKQGVPAERFIETVLIDSDRDSVH
jgi:hypothetical protein